MRFRTDWLVPGLIFCILLTVWSARAAVKSWEGTIEIPTYLLGPADPNPAFPLLHGAGVYPYTMLDNLTNYRVSKTYRALYLENKYLKLTILPDLGGHLYSIYDKIDQREMLYRNHVVKYGLIGPRGAWISGGIEFSFPFAHTMITVSPVESLLRRNPDGSATAVVGAIDRVSNMYWQVALTLRPRSARVEQRVTLFNPTPSKHLYLFWANAAVKASDDLQYIYPMRETISDDPYAVVESWPVWRAVDQSWYKNDPDAMALFARQPHRNYFGVYYHNSDYGVVHVANFRQDPGKKVWTWGTASSGLIWARLLSDNDGPYCEIQSGRFPTQGYREFMNPRRVEKWTEYWYPVRGLGGGFVAATKWMALNVIYPAAGSAPAEVKLKVSPARDLSNVALVVKLGPGLLREISNVYLEPLRTHTVVVPVPDLEGARRALSVRIKSSQNKVLLRWSASEPIDGNPDFVPAAGTHLRRIRYTPKTPLEELFLHGVFLEKRGRPREAEKAFAQVLERDPSYVPALVEDAWRNVRAANFPVAESFVARALARNGEDPAVHYVAGTVYRAVGRLTLAEDAFWASVHYGGPPAPAFAELGEISIQLGYDAQASRLLRDALRYNPGDALAWSDLAVAERLAGKAHLAARASSEAVRKMPLLPYALAEQWMEQRTPRLQAGSSTLAEPGWTKIVGIGNYLAVAAWYHSLRDFSAADAVLHLALENLPAPERSPMIYYYLASDARAEGKGRQATEDAQKAASLPGEELFPNRLEDAEVLAEAVALSPNDSHASYALGNFMFAHGRYREASDLWLRALAEGFESPVLLRNLGVYAWKVKQDLPSAAGFYLRAIHFAPRDYRLYTALDEIYAQEGNSAARARLFRRAPLGVMDQDTVRARYALFLTGQSKFIQALDVLNNHQFKPWEGGQEIHSLFVVSNLEKGKAALAAGNSAEAADAFRAAMEYPENLGVGMPYRPPFAEQFYWLGQALAVEGRHAEARAAWQNAASNAEDDDTAAAVFSALAFEKLGNQARARQILTRCTRSADAPEAGSYNYFVAGLAERYSHHPNRARTYFAHALQMNPLFWQARLALDRLNHHR